MEYVLVIGMELAIVGGLVIVAVHFEKRRRARIGAGLPLEDVKPTGFEVNLSPSSAQAPPPPPNPCVSSHDP